ncbi:MAG: type II toxin-antitoxin system prevent-host-death family antitoxin [Gemmatimonadetes bacterium]|nr:type II toxin-antitoxin system prevent-host-death family antitoxin [Gemmatimonadota bacterium]
MSFIDVNEAKTNLFCLLAKVDAGEEIVIARDGKPVAQLVPYERHHETRRFGAMKDRVVVDDHFFDPLPEVELTAWEK